MIAYWKKQDPPPNRVKPVPIRVIRTLLFIAENSQDDHLKATADMIVIAFFFLLRPGEYTASPSDTQPFDFKSVQLFLGDTRLDLATSTDAQLRCATFASLTFDTQKNGVRGEVVGLGLSGDLTLCPVKAITRRIIHLRNARAPPNTPLSLCFNRNQWRPVTPSQVSTMLKNTVTYLGPALGFMSTDVSARCLRAAGANALLNARIDPEVITLIGRWRSDEMLRYLHVQNRHLMKDYASRMLRHGDYTLIPNQLVPMH